MISGRALFRAAAILLAVFVLLMVLEPVVSGIYGAFFRAQASVFYSHLVGDHRIEFQAIPDPVNQEDTAICIGRKRDPGYDRVTCRSAYIGYLPTAFFLALVLSTPVPRGRRLRAYLLGTLFIELYVLARVGLLVLMCWTNHILHCTAAHSAFWPSSAWRKLLDMTMTVLVFETSVYILIPALIWLLIAFPLSSLRDIFRT